MWEQKEYTVEEIINASQNNQDLKAGGAVSQRFSLYTPMDIKLELSDAPKVQMLISYIERKYNVKLKIVGGGRGCTKFTFHVVSEEGAAQLVKKLMRDEEFKELAKGANFDIVIVPSSYQRHQITTEPTKETPSLSPKNTNKRVSADGTIQETGAY